MAIEKVRAFLRPHGLEGDILEFDTSSATVELAAAAVGCRPQRIAKSLAFMGAGGPLLVVAAGDARIHNSKFKAQFSVKATMLGADQTEELIGHAVGGVCPFAVNPGVAVYLDESLRRFGTVFPACGSANSAIELSLRQLEQLTGYKSWVDVCKLPEDSVAE